MRLSSRGCACRVLFHHRNESRLWNRGYVLEPIYDALGDRHSGARELAWLRGLARERRSEKGWTGEGGEREGGRRWRRLHQQLQAPPRLYPCHGTGASEKCELPSVCSGLPASPLFL